MGRPEFCRHARSVLRYRARNDGHQLTTVFLELILKIGDTGITSTKFGAVKRKFLHEQVHLFTRVSERPLSNTGRDVPFFFP